ncbi:hypothetical protein A3Q56_08624, partial [Intoshia linei]
MGCKFENSKLCPVTVMDPLISNAPPLVIEWKEVSKNSKMNQTKIIKKNVLLPLYSDYPILPISVSSKNYNTDNKNIWPISRNALYLNVY